MATDTYAADPLAPIGNVPTEYIHHDRQVEPREPLIVPSGVLKWYNVFDPGNPLFEGLENDSRQFVERFLATGVADLHYGMGLVVLHHSTANDFLFIGSWRGHQEYWQSVFIRNANSQDPWTPIEHGPISPVFCVWEMAPIWHERNAWVTYLKSNRTIEDRRAWLADRLSAIM
jgi:hypothetical protein